ncbi:hypothetical protein X847_1330 [Listeria monocytogenes Lm_1889]|nr:hypothetical protein X844_0113 [Listeria monocytogenes Lm_1823]EXL24338.1 hypothetical protein X847_1330 [Listeria monocytogenes Lm_1889]
MFHDLPSFFFSNYNMKKAPYLTKADTALLEFLFIEFEFTFTRQDA